MPSLNYKKEFANLVEHGLKPHTIRANRKYPIKAGDSLYHFYAMRSKQCRRLGESTCTMVQEIQITERGVVKIEGQALDSNAIITLAMKDGFKNLRAFLEFFRDNHGLPFAGQLIHWDPKEFVRSAREG